MFYEEFDLFGESDNPMAEYFTDDLKIIYYMNHFSDGTDDICRVITHEWLHGLFDWATEDDGHWQHKCDMTDSDGDHFAMKLISFYE